MKLLLVLNDPPYGTERCDSALRLAHVLAKTAPESEITVFLMADAVAARWTNSPPSPLPPTGAGVLTGQAAKDS